MSTLQQSRDDEGHNKDRHQLPNGVQLSFSRCPRCSNHVMTKVTTKTDKADLSCGISWEACQASLQALDRSTDALVTELDSSRMSSGACHMHEARVRRVNFQFQSPRATKKLLTSFDCVFAISISNNLAVSETWLRILLCSRLFPYYPFPSIPLPPKAHLLDDQLPVKSSLAQLHIV